MRQPGQFWIYLLINFCICLTVLVFEVESKSLKLFDEVCDGDCDERKGLSCSSEKKCECMSPNSTIFDPTRSQCVTKAGHRCRRIGSENLCVSHASCLHLNLLCECEKDYFQTKNGSCAPVASYGESCSSRKPCDKANGIECIGNKKNFQCQCKFARDQFYSPEDKKCISYAGGNCSFELSCVKNAKCAEEIFELRRGEAPSGKGYFYNATVGKKCKCSEGFTMTENRECLATYQTPCEFNAGDICNPEENLNCFNNKICLCQNPLQQVYSEERNKCLNLVGSRCYKDKSIASASAADCIANAECIETGTCRCKTGFTVSENRTCLKDLGESCQKDECNLSRGLSCHQNATCNCIDDILVYNPLHQRCEGEEDSPCGMLVLHLNGLGSTSMDLQLQQKNLCSADKAQTQVTIKCADGLECKNIHGYNQCK